MKINCERVLLSDALAGVSKAITMRSNVSVLEGVLLKTGPEGLTLTGYDLEIGITTTIPAMVHEDGEIVLSARLLGDMVRRITSETVLIESDEKLTTTVSGGAALFTILGMPAQDYPELPSPGADPVVTIAGNVFKGMVEKTIYAVSSDEKKPAHTGELMAIEKDKMTIVALDGYRLAICEQEIEAEKEISIIIPHKTMNEVARLIGDSEEEISISANRRYVIFNANGYKIISRLLEGEFLDYKKVLPEGHKTKVTVNVKELAASIERASLIITERVKNPLRVQIGAELTIRCQTAIGKVSDVVAAKIEGDEMEIGFNNRYLLDALRNSGEEEVVFELSGPLSPAKVLPVEGNDFIYLVLPVRFKND